MCAILSERILYADAASEFESRVHTQRTCNISQAHSALHPPLPSHLSIWAHKAGHPIFASSSKLLQVVTVRVDRAPHPPDVSPGISTKQPSWRWRNASTHKTLCSRKFTYFESISRVVTEPDQLPHSRSSPWRIFYAHLVTQCHGDFNHDVCLFVCGIPENKFQRSPDDVPNFMYDTQYRAHLTNIRGSNLSSQTFSMIKCRMNA